MMATRTTLISLLVCVFCTAYGTNVPSRVCSLAPDPGPCKASIPSYFYNSTSQTCEEFIYGGCQGNRNRFRDFLSCMKACHSCDVEGARYSSCDRGPACLRTCDNRDQNLYCRAPCRNGCTCPSYMVLDEKNRRCVLPYFCPRTCEYNGNTYKPGQSWDCSERGQCRRCYCFRSGYIFKLRVACPTYCKLDNGRKIPFGSSYQPEPCTHCTCLSTGKVICAVQDCARPTCENPVRPPGQCCPTCPESCTLRNGTTVPHGTSYKPEPCTSCECKDGELLCIAKLCASPDCKGAYIPEGECCAVCPESCTLSNGTTVPHGTSYKPDPCSGCTCNNGTSVCYIQDCAAPPCNNYYVPPGQCCPVCPPPNTCRYNGQVYNAGDTFNSSDGCNTCTCTFGGLVACTERACVRPKMQCPTASLLQNMLGICADMCSSDSECELDEKCCRNGCGRKCMKGVLCAAVLCAQPKCNFLTGVVVPAGPDECCPSCGCSVGGGKVVRVGESYTSGDGCNQCGCTSRGPLCTLRHCF